MAECKNCGRKSCLVPALQLQHDAAYSLAFDASTVLWDAVGTDRLDTALRESRGARRTWEATKAQLDEAQVDCKAHTVDWYAMAAEWRSQLDAYRTAADGALDDIAAACGCAHWEYPGQVVRDVLALKAERDDLQKRLGALAGPPAAPYTYQVVKPGHALGGQIDSVSVIERPEPTGLQRYHVEKTLRSGQGSE